MAPVTKPAPVAAPTSAPAPKKPQSSGFAKGFLLGKPQKKATPAPATSGPPVEDLSHIKAKPKEDRLKLAEIEAMQKASQDAGKSDWVTPELLKAIMGNEKIAQAMGNPNFLKVLFAGGITCFTKLIGD